MNLWDGILIKINDMITAEEARTISESNRFPHIEEQIIEAANNGLRSISLKGDLFLKDDEKQKLTELGYKVSFGQGGKCGPFDIIHW